MRSEEIKKKIIVICGPTTVGKSALAIKLAKRFNGEIISADSRQIYKGMNIGTGKVTKKEMTGVPHFMLDIANPKKRFTVAEFQKMGKEKIESILSREKTPIICGGTGFYISALIDGINFPEVPPNPKLRAELEKKTAEQLYAILKKLDPKRAEAIDWKNKRRVARAIEIAKALGKVPFVEVRPPQTCGGLTSTGLQPYKTLWIGIKLPKEELKNKIKIRLFQRLKQGMVAEAKKLHKNGLSWRRMEEFGLEYRYLAKYLNNKISKEQMTNELETEIWHYARRQMTWFRRDKRIKWFAPDKYKIVEKIVKRFINGSIS